MIANIILDHRSVGTDGKLTMWPLDMHMSHSVQPWHLGNLVRVISVWSLVVVQFMSYVRSED